MGIRWKIGLVLLATSLIPLSILGAAGLYEMRNSLKAEIGRNYELLARDKAAAIAAIIDRRVKETRALARHPRILDAVRAANRRWETSSMQRIEDIDRRWIASKGETDEARETLESPLSSFLREYRDRDPLEYGEIFITGSNGATVAMTSTLTDFYQADEGWWREGFGAGSGNVYIDDRGYDLSVDAVVTGIVAPVFDGDGDTVAGILKINFLMAHIPSIIINPYETGDVSVSLMRERGNAVAEASGGAHKIATENELAVMIAKRASGWMEDEHEIGPTITGFARVPVSRTIFSRIKAPEELKGIAGEGWGESAWYVFIDRTRDHAYAPVHRLTWMFFLGITLLVALVLAVAALLSGAITRPLLRLRKGAETIATGNLDHRLANGSRDEIGALAHDIDDMVLTLKETLASREELNREIQARERTEAILTTINRLRERFIRETDHLILFDSLLKDILDLTDSEYGFIGDVQHKSDGAPYLTCYAFSNIAWNDETRRFYEENKAKGFVFEKLDNLFGLVVTSGEPVIANNPSNDPRRAGLPPGHPPLNAFLGIPVYFGERLVGEIGLANRPNGYDEDLLAYIAPVVEACAQIITARWDKRARAEAETRIAETAEKLRISNTELEEFAYAVSHDLQEPLRMVTTYLQLLERTLGEELDEDSTEFFGFAIDGGKRMQTLIRDLLDYSRVTTKGEALVEAFSEDALEETLKNLRMSADEAGAEITHDPLPMVMADRTQLVRLFQNLIGNAIKYRATDRPPPDPCRLRNCGRGLPVLGDRQRDRH